MAYGNDRLFHKASLLAQKWSARYPLPPWLSWEDFVASIFMAGLAAINDYNPSISGSISTYVYSRMYYAGFWAELDRVYYTKRKVGSKYLRRVRFDANPKHFVGHVESCISKEAPEKLAVMREFIGRWASRLKPKEREFFLKYYIYGETLKQVGRSFNRSEAWASVFAKWHVKPAISELEWKLAEA